MDSSKPDWAQRIAAERAARDWTQQRLIEELRRASPNELPSNESLGRMVKSWEAGKHRPSPQYRQLIAKAFGTVTLAIFGERPTLKTTGTGEVTTLELVERIQVSDIDAAALDAIEQQVDKLCTEYSWANPYDLLAEAHVWIDHLNHLLGSKVSISQHHRILELAGWLTLLAATVSFDTGDLKSAEGTRRVALRIGQEGRNLEIEAWGHELSGWFNLTHQRWEKVLPSAQLGQQLAGQLGIAAQLATQEAEALARLGAKREADKVLAKAQTLLEQLPATEKPLHHFHVEHDKFDKALMHIHLIQGDDRQAAMLSEELERKFTEPDGTMTKPMRVADARSVRAVIVAREGDLDHAIELGHAALDIERQSIPGLIKNTTELADFLMSEHPSNNGVQELLKRRDSLATQTP